MMHKELSPSSAVPDLFETEGVGPAARVLERFFPSPSLIAGSSSDEMTSVLSPYLGGRILTPGDSISPMTGKSGDEERKKCDVCLALRDGEGRKALGDAIMPAANHRERKAHLR